MNNTPQPPTVRNGAWRLDGNRTIPGVRISTGKTHAFIANEHVLSVATALADHLEATREKDDR
ncbi:hypothetical protein [Brachybacterium sp. AOP35-5H-19]|uniref:hypothetical protein n=1 Tax=Brachybacterium sp. AOP35-5H-19 TaxID=3457685 RepID=UPI004034447A